MLHGLGEASPAAAPDFAAEWPGAVIALDFTGHGASTLPIGGGYTAEILLADADLVLADLGRATIVGRGLGAYIALQLAGARAERVHGVVLADGPGISGGASDPTTQAVVTMPASRAPARPVRARRAGSRPAPARTMRRRSLGWRCRDRRSRIPITVTARFRPAWLDAVAREHGVIEADSIAEAVAAYR